MSERPEKSDSYRLLYRILGPVGGMFAGSVVAILIGLPLSHLFPMSAWHLIGAGCGLGFFLGIVYPKLGACVIMGARIFDR